MIEFQILVLKTLTFYVVTVTLLGAHTLGHTHIVNEGYGQLPSSIPSNVDPDLLNAWDDSPALFDNHYHSNLADGPEVGLVSARQYTCTLSDLYL